MFPKIKCWKAFTIRVALVCQLILQAVKVEDTPWQGRTHLISIDEKTGIQALERIAFREMQKGRKHRVDPEYKRHGTTTLIAAQEVSTGRLIHYQLGATRTEKDFEAFLQNLLEAFAQDEQAILLLDHLNTHMSASIVELVARLIGFTDDLGKKEYRGILQNMNSRKAFLEDSTHRIRFVFTPKHCSWLNPVENWFSQLQRHVITRGNFHSVKELEDKVRAYIDYYNRCLAKPLKWKFSGFLKAAEKQEKRKET